MSKMNSPDTQEVRSLKYEITIPESWGLVRFDDVCDVTDYVANGSFESLRNNVTYRDTPDYAILIRLRDFTKAWNGNYVYVDEHAYTFLDKSKVFPGDLIISNVGEPGKSFIVPDLKMPMTLGPNSVLVRPKSGVFNKYINAFFASDWAADLISQITTGTAQKKFNKTGLRSTKIPIPPYQEQTRIVEKLEELLSDLDAGVAELKAARKKLGQYRQSLLKAAVEGALTAEWRKQNVPFETGAQLLDRILLERRARWEAKQLAKFKEQGKIPPKDWQKKYPEPVQPDTTNLPPLPEGWVWASVEQIASDKRYSLSIGPFGSNLKVPDYRDSGVPLVFVRNIRSGNYGGGYTKYVTPEKAIELSAHSVAAGDVLVTKMGEPPGDAGVYPDDQPPAIITADCIKIRCWRELMSPHFLKSVINSHIGKRQIKPLTQGVAQKKVSLGRFTSLVVPVPSAVEQALIMRMVDAADGEAAEQLAAIELSLKQSTAQRQNILRAAFAGQLVPQDPTDEPASVLLERIRAERAAHAAVNKPRGRKVRAATA
jgi:type I restriction enzyme S subunit